MTALRMYFDGERVGPLFERSTQRKGDQVRAGVRYAANEAAQNIEAKGAQDIMLAPGNWGPRWTKGLHAEVTEGGGNVRISIFHDVPYFSVFQNGKQIFGKPLLAIPLSFADVPKGMWASDYPGGLFRVDRKDGGAPLLLSFIDKQPKYFLKESVTIPKKFHIVEIARAEAKKIREYYRDAKTLA